MSSSAVRGVTWSREETDILISMWSQSGMADQIEGNARDHSPYEAISAELVQQGYHRTWVQVRVKLKNLTQWYKAMKQRKLTMDERNMNKSHLKLYQRLDPILKDKPLTLRDNSASFIEKYSIELNSEKASKNKSQSSQDDSAVEPREIYANSASKNVNSKLGQRVITITPQPNGKGQRLDMHHELLDYRMHSKGRSSNIMEDEDVPFIKRYMARLEAGEGSSQQRRHSENGGAAQKLAETILIKDEAVSEPEPESTIDTYEVTDEDVDTINYNEGNFSDGPHCLSSATGDWSDAGRGTKHYRIGVYNEGTSECMNTPTSAHPNKPAWLRTNFQCTGKRATPNRDHLNPCHKVETSKATDQAKLNKRKRPLNSTYSSPHYGEDLVKKMVDTFTEHSQNIQMHMLELFNSYQRESRDVFMAFEEKRLKMQLEWEEKQKREERDHQLKMLHTLAQMFQCNHQGEGKSQPNSVPESTMHVS